ncbi:Beta-2 adrenergic receptor [Trichoplax sp. H2]|nr:Beta-2 adrenergic receptor [Trichoplax sp. H2]|eukprot:RDD44200.1 Beta-2 adrenergic receptor [Trichoplax sp. H2]
MNNSALRNSTIMTIHTLYKIAKITEQCLAFITVVANVLILTLILSKKQLRTPFNAALGSMAMACLVFTCSYYFLATIIGFTQATFPIFSLALYPISNSTISILNLHVTLICILRYFFVASPFAYQKFITKKSISIILVSIWICMLSFVYGMRAACGYLIRSYNTTTDHYENYTVARQIYCFLYIGIVAILPVFAIFITYFQLHHIIKRHINNIDDQRKSRSKSLTSLPDKEYSKDKALKQMLCLLMMFLISWIPFFMIRIFIKHRIPNLTLILLYHGSSLLVHVYIFFCPLHHAYYTPDIREEFQQWFKDLPGIVAKGIKKLFCF